MKITILVIIFSLFLVTSSFAGAVESEAAIRELLKAKTLKCKLTAGYQMTFDGKKIEGKEAPFSTTPEGSIITIVQIDSGKKSALLVANAGTSNLEFSWGETGLNFIERTESGNINLYKVFANKYKNHFFFVNSRHPQVSVVETISLPSQFYGSCSILE